ncbi:hypothetical protein [Fervidobacterium sp.]
MGIIVGAIAGIIDIIPMILQNLTWDANLSAFSMWIIVGIFIATTEYKIASGFKGIIIAFLVLCPSAILIGWKEPLSLIPIGIMTIVLGALSGIAIEKTKRQSTK